VTRSRLRPEPIVFVCAGCAGLLLDLPKRWAKGSDVAQALEAVRLELPCECDGEDDELLGESD